MHGLHQREVAQRNGGEVGRNHRTLHVEKGVCLQEGTWACCLAGSAAKSRTQV
jgi:hypothetical protein